MNPASAIPRGFKTVLEATFRASLRHPTLPIFHSAAPLSHQTPSRPASAPRPRPTRLGFFKNSLLSYLPILLICLNLNGVTRLAFAEQLDAWEVRSNVPGSGTFLNGLRFLDGAFYAMRGRSGGDGMIYRSTDAVNWQLVSTSPSKPLYDASWGNGIYLAVGKDGALLRSQDGLTWVSVGFSSNTRDHLGIVFAEGKFFVVGTGGYSISSNDGIDWTPIVSTGTSNTAVIHYQDGFYLCGTGGNLRRSDDGTMWSSISHPGGLAEMSSLFAGPSTLVCGASHGYLYKTTNGNTWSPVTLPVNMRTDAGVFFDNKWVIGGFGEILWSDDLATWHAAATPASSTVKIVDFASGSGLFLAAANNGAIYQPATGQVVDFTLQAGASPQAQVGSSASAQITLVNTGTATISSIGLSREGPHSSGFKSSLAIGPVLPGNSTVLPVIFEPTFVGEASAKIQIEAFGPQRRRRKVEVSGLGIAPSATPMATVAGRIIDISTRLGIAGASLKTGSSVKSVGFESRQ